MPNKTAIEWTDYTSNPIVPVEGGWGCTKVSYGDGGGPVTTWPPPGIRWYYSDDAVAIAHADCRDVLPLLEPVDLVLTDPPYGIDLDTSNHKYKHGISRPKLLGDTGVDLAPIVSLGIPSILWGGNCFASQLPDFPGWLCWNKTVRDGAGIRQADMELAWTNFVRRPRAKQHLWIGAYRDSESGERALHPTQKPVALMAWCIGVADEYINAQTILDPFMGSGTTLRAAKDLGRKAIGIEIEERYCEIAANRMAQSVMELGL